MNVVLRRTVRFSLPPPGRPLSLDEPRHNAFGGWPPSRGISVYGELEIEVRGEPDPRTGYLVNISAIDEAVRGAALPFLRDESERQSLTREPIDPASALPALSHLVAARLGQQLAGDVTGVTWRVTPTYSVAHRTPLGAPTARGAPESTHMHDLVELSQRFDFSASHRLHCPEYDDQTNRRIFGKCNNPNGHGHNYRLEVTVQVALAPDRRLTLDALERIVDTLVIERFDHKHLNSDCPEFASLNPSVEHIAKVCYELLAPAVRDADATLRHVTVWETDKTACTYPAAVSR